MEETYLELDGKIKPSPKTEGVSVAYNKIWSKNTGRTTNGSMVGDIVAIKKSITLEFPPLSPAEINKIQSVVNNKSKPYFTVYLFDGKNTVASNELYYAGAPSMKLYSVANDINYYTGYVVEIIEK